MLFAIHYTHLVFVYLTDVEVFLSTTEKWQSKQYRLHWTKPGHRNQWQSICLNAIYIIVLIMTFYFFLAKNKPKRPKQWKYKQS